MLGATNERRADILEVAAAVLISLSDDYTPESVERTEADFKPRSSVLLGDRY
jgi:hypothetical protein